MIRDRFGCAWAGRADLARDWGGDVAAVVWGDLLGRYHPTRTIVEEGGVPRLDPTGTPVGWDDVIPVARWAPLVAACQETATGLVWEDAMTRAADTGEDPDTLM